MMKYYRIDKLTGQREEVARERARELLSRCYSDVEQILDTEQTVPLMSCLIEIVRCAYEV